MSRSRVCVSGVEVRNVSEISGNAARYALPWKNIVLQRTALVTESHLTSQSTRTACSMGLPPSDSQNICFHGTGPYETVIR